MGKEYSENLRSIKNTGNDLTVQQMLDTSEKLIVGQSDEIYEDGAVDTTVLNKMLSAVA